MLKRLLIVYGVWALIIVAVSVTALAGSDVPTAQGAKTSTGVRVNRDGLSLPPVEAEGLASAACDADGACSIAYVLLSPDQNRPLLYFTRVGADGSRQADQALSANNSWFPALLRARDGVLHVVWIETDEGKRYKVVYRRSGDGGKSWSEPVALGRGLTHGPLILEQDGAGVLVLARTSSGREPRSPQRILTQVSRDGGVTWDTTQLQGPKPGEVSELRVVRSGEAVWFAWIETAATGMGIFANRIAEGKPLESPVAVVRDSRLRIQHLQLRANGGRIGAFWKRLSFRGESIVASVSSDQGSTWQESGLRGPGVRVITYGGNLGEHNLDLVTLEEEGLGPAGVRAYRLRCQSFEFDQLRKLNEGAVPEGKENWNRRYEDLPECLFATIGDLFVTAVRGRESAARGAVMLLFCGKLSGGGDIVPVAPDEGGNEKSLVAVTGLPCGVAVFYRRERTARLHPEVAPPSDLMMSRIALPQ
jgi:hypothetical protein